MKKLRKRYGIPSTAHPLVFRTTRLAYEELTQQSREVTLAAVARQAEASTAARDFISDHDIVIGSAPATSAPRLYLEE